MRDTITDLSLRIHTFWQANPAFCYSLSLLIGIYAAFAWSPVLLFPLCIIALSSLSNPFRLLLALILFAAAYGFIQFQYIFPTQPLQGTALFQIESISSASHHFGSYWKYRGKIRYFMPDNKDEQGGKNIPCVLTIPQKKGIVRPRADSSYWIYGTLKPINKNSYTLSVNLMEPWHPVPKSFSLAEWRHHTKKAVQKMIRKKIRGEQTGDFLGGLATGEFEDKMLSHDFVRFGLQHIMAISGFHFALLAAILSFFFRIFFSDKKMNLLLIFLLSSYFLFLGLSPSIIRAWISVLIALFSVFFERERSGINSLGVGIIAICLMDPLMTLGIGFQFSVAATAAILILYPAMHRLLKKLWVERTLSHMLQMTTIDQHGYCLLAFFRDALALTLAVNLAALPMTLFFFQKFPWMSLIYNLFFPFLVSFAMFLLVLGCGIGLILPIFGNAVHWINSIYTHFILNLVVSMPASLDFVWRTPPIPAEFVIAYLTLLFTFGILSLERKEETVIFKYL